MTEPEPWMRVTIDAELPGPGYDFTTLELLTGVLDRLTHDGLFPRRLSFEIDLDYVDNGFEPPD
jgi:hypothetical protein